MLVFANKKSYPISAEDTVVFSKLVEYYMKYDPRGAAFLRCLNLNDFTVRWSTYYMSDGQESGIMGSWSPMNPYTVYLIGPMSYLEYPIKRSKWYPVDTRMLNHILLVFKIWLHEMTHAFQFMPHKDAETMFKEVRLSNASDFKRTNFQKVMDALLTIYRMFAFCLSSSISQLLYKMDFLTVEADARKNVDYNEQADKFVQNMLYAIDGIEFIVRSKNSPYENEFDEKVSEKKYIDLVGPEIWKYANDLYSTLRRMQNVE